MTARGTPTAGQDDGHQSTKKAVAELVHDYDSIGPTHFRGPRAPARSSLGGAKHGLQRCTPFVHIGWHDDHVWGVLDALASPPTRRWSEVVANQLNCRSDRRRISSESFGMLWQEECIFPACIRRKEGATAMATSLYWVGAPDDSATCGLGRA